jgi:ACR3 family arsenite transporter
MSDEKKQGIGFFERYLTLWVLLCMAAGILSGPPKDFSKGGMTIT